MLLLSHLLLLLVYSCCIGQCETNLQPKAFLHRPSHVFLFPQRKPDGMVTAGRLVAYRYSIVGLLPDPFDVAVLFKTKQHFPPEQFHLFFAHRNVVRTTKLFNYLLFQTIKRDSKDTVVSSKSVEVQLLIRFLDARFGFSKPCCSIGNEISRFPFQ